MKTFNYLIYTIPFLFIMSCSGLQTDRQKQEDFLTLHIIDSLQIKSDIIEIIEGYIRKYPQYDSFVLTCCPSISSLNESENMTNKKFLIGPAYELTFHDYEPLLFMDIKGKRIFIMCGLESLFYNSHHSQKSAYYLRKIRRGMDSMIINPDWVIKNGEELYIRRALYFVINEQGIIFTSDRPDTIFLPKQLESSVSFDPNKKY